MISEQIPTDTITAQTVASERYPEYKDSGVDWLGEIPTHWEVRKLKHLVIGRLKYGANESAEYDNRSLPRYIRITDFGEDGKLKDDTFKSLPYSIAEHYLLTNGDILFARSGATVGKTFQFKNYNGMACFAGYLIKAAPNEQLVKSDFLYYYTKGSHYDIWKSSIFIQATIQNIGADKYNELLIPLPPLSEQTRLAEFLDRKTAQIDQAIAQKERLIELLNERRQVMIHRAVTRGLNPDVPMKDSGIDWIGEIPAHWEVKRAKYIFDEIDERSETGNEELLSVSHMTGVTPRSEKTISMFQAEDYSGSKLCRKDDLVFNIMWAWMGALGVSDLTGIVSPSYGVYRQKKPNTFNSWYLEHLMRDADYVAEYNRRSTGLHSSRLRLYADMFFDMEIGFPDKEEQDSIVEKTLSQTKQIDSGISLLEKQIQKLQELKSTLINSAVTGKIKV